MNILAYRRQTPTTIPTIDRWMYHFDIHTFRKEKKAVATDSAGPPPLPANTLDPPRSSGHHIRYHMYGVQHTHAYA